MSLCLRVLVNVFLCKAAKEDTVQARMKSVQVGPTHMTDARFCLKEGVGLLLQIANGIPFRSRLINSNTGQMHLFLLSNNYNYLERRLELNSLSNRHVHQQPSILPTDTRHCLSSPLYAQIQGYQGERDKVMRL